jgi:hypothetical protein
MDMASMMAGMGGGASSAAGAFNKNMDISNS